MIPCPHCNGQVLQFQDDLGPRCVQCGQTVSPPKMAPAKNGTWEAPRPFYGQREKLLPAIDNRLASEAEKEEQRKHREQKLASELKRRSLMKKVAT